MKIAVIYGNERRESTWNAVRVMKESMSRCGEVTFEEFFLPRDMPEFCRGCFSCFFKGEQTCPHAKYVQPIARALLEADGMIFASPVYVMAETAAMKSLLDHLAYQFLVHRPEPAMFTKKAMIVTTTAGAGLRRCTATIAESLRYWGVNRVYHCGYAVQAVSWDGIVPHRRQRFEHRLQKAGGRFYRELAGGKRHPAYPIQRLMFLGIRLFLRGQKKKGLDYEHWKEHGWLRGNSPFRAQKTKKEP